MQQHLGALLCNYKVFSMAGQLLYMSIADTVSFPPQGLSLRIHQDVAKIRDGIEGMSHTVSKGDILIQP